MRKTIAALATAALVTGQAWGACEKPADAAALQVAALQQEMMVAALVCKAAGAYNDFVLSHRTALQQSDKTLLAFFIAANPQTGDGDYNLYKTELANKASMRSLNDMLFCARAAAFFQASQGRPLEEVLAMQPTGNAATQCRIVETATALQPSAKEDLPRTAEK
jgi:hypothetical protein